MPRLVFAIDFDGVLHDQNPDPGRKMGKPLPRAKEAMMLLKEGGHRVIIFTHRAASNQYHVAEWLKFFGIPYDEITAVKPNADYFIDDRGVHFVSWDELIPKLSTLKSTHEKEEAVNNNSPRYRPEADYAHTEGRSQPVQHDHAPKQWSPGEEY